MRGLAFAAALGLTVLATVPMTAQAASDPPEIQLAKRVMKYTGDTDNTRASVPHMASVVAEHFASGAQGAEVVYNQKALDKAVRVQVKKYTPQFVNADAKAYATVFTPEELRQYVAWFKKKETKRGKLPKALDDKASALAEARAENYAPLRPKMAKDIFASYCTGKTACTPTVQKVIDSYGHL
jgi:hypothetical protein